MRSRAEVVSFLSSDDYLINKLDVDEMYLEVLDRVLPDVAITVAAEVAVNTIDVTIQLKKSNGDVYGEKSIIHFWISDAVAGAECTSAPNGGVSITTGTLNQQITANKHFKAVTDATGKAVIRVIDSGTPTFYLNVESNGYIVTSSAITFI